MLRTLRLLIVAPLAVLLNASFLFAAPGHPVAVRWWGQGMVSIETWWNLTVVIDPYNDQIGYEVPELSADLVLVTHEHFDHNNVEAIGGDPHVARGLDEEGRVRSFQQVLDRRPGSEAVTWREARLRVARSPHAVTVTSIPAWHGDQQGAERGATAMFLVEVDGVRIVHCGDVGQARLTQEQLDAAGRVDVLLVPVGGVYTIGAQGAAGVVAQLKPRVVAPIHYKTDALQVALNSVEPFLAAVADSADVVRAGGNTVAVSSNMPETDRPRVVVLSYKPWRPTGELARLLEGMNRECEASQEAFRPLTAEQMNWRPPNGTHTPRWNAEHMMGRQLGFFSQIYAALDPAIEPVDLNPAQSPDAYQPAHPEWSGAEEAWQMERASAFVRRFAYLLQGHNLDAPAPGSRWTLRRLLEQMERHFGEHTANVRRKFELDGWPEE